MEYELIVDSDESGLSRKVNARIRDGWTPFGSPGLSSSMGGNPQYASYEKRVFCQAVTRDENPTPRNN